MGGRSKSSALSVKTSSTGDRLSSRLSQMTLKGVHNKSTVPAELQPSGPRPTPEVPGRESIRICHNSVNYLAAHPDSLQPLKVACSCGRQLSLADDWYTEMYDGTMLCWQCATCARCGVDGSTACRRLVSISGYVLCYSCIKLYGELRVRQWRPPVVPNALKLARRQNKRKSTAAPVRADSVSPTSLHNIGYDTNWWQTEQTPECRPVIRYRDYPRPVSDTTHLDPTNQIIGFYDATQAQFSSMICPGCRHRATGPESCVAAAISQVYHRDCFRCVACKWPLGTGCRVAGKHYLFCTCWPPMQWCTRSRCTEERKAHHATFKCRLEPIHPGGRQQHDPKEMPVKPRQVRSAKADTMTDESAKTSITATATAQAPPRGNKAAPAATTSKLQQPAPLSKSEKAAVPAPPPSPPPPHDQAWKAKPGEKLDSKSK